MRTFWLSKPMHQNYLRFSAILPCTFSVTYHNALTKKNLSQKSEQVLGLSALVQGIFSLAVFPWLHDAGC